jgi:hypothetical protein
VAEVEKKLPKNPVGVNSKEGLTEGDKQAICKIEFGVSW